MIDDNRSRVKTLAHKYIDRNDPTGWFEELYSSADGRETAIPWADLTVNPNLAQWIEKNRVTGAGKTALVVGCGLGDDAEALSQIGFKVVGFDISPTAISWCKQRFSNSQVDYLIDDLLQPTALAARSFDLVLESYTLQALPAKVRPQAIANVRQFVATEGKLLIICRGRDEREPIGELPWPLTKKELAYFEELGLTVVNFEDYFDRQSRQVRRFRIEYVNLVPTKPER